MKAVVKNNGLMYDFNAVNGAYPLKYIKLSGASNISV
jgi:hypothetical protein